MTFSNGLATVADFHLTMTLSLNALWVGTFECDTTPLA
jgi:hypothetical protein